MDGIFSISLACPPSIIVPVALWAAGVDAFPE
jgi:hypothetical protein